MSATNPDGALVEKVRKLLALSESPNEHEAALAAEKAQDLMLRHGIAIAQIAISQGASTIGVDDARVEGRIDPWRRQLAASIAKSMGGRVVFTRYYASASVMSFFGPAGGAQSIAALYRHLEAQLVTISAIATGQPQREIGPRPDVSHLVPTRRGGPARLAALAPPSASHDRREQSRARDHRLRARPRGPGALRATSHGP